jgi:CheY-like chemotaxis protein
MKKILCIDDEIFSIKSFIELLNDKQLYYVKSTDSLSEAAHLLSKEIFDLLILDIMMPHENVMQDNIPPKEAGVEYIKRLRTNSLNIPILEKNKSIPIVVLTGVADHSIISELKKLNLFSLLRKPVPWKTFLIEIERCLSVPGEEVVNATE